MTQATHDLPQTDHGFLAPAIADWPTVLPPEAAALSTASPLIVEVRSHHRATWIAGVVDRLNQMAALRPDWNGEGAPPPTPTALQGLLIVLSRVLPPHEALPSLVPTAEGGAQAEWHRNGWDLEIEVDPTGAGHVWAQHDGDDLWEGDPNRETSRIRTILSQIG